MNLSKKVLILGWYKEKSRCHIAFVDHFDNIFSHVRIRICSKQCICKRTKCKPKEIYVLVK